MNVGGRRISLRTIHDNIDVSAIAGVYGGGGHAKASGCSLTTEAYNDFVAKPFELEPLRIDALRNRYNLKESTNGSLYKNNGGDTFFIYPKDAFWKLEWNEKTLDHAFLSFQEAENAIKRNYGAWLVHDEQYFNYLAKMRISSVKEDAESVEKDLFFRYLNDAPDGGHLPVTH